MREWDRKPYCGADGLYGLPGIGQWMNQTVAGIADGHAGRTHPCVYSLSVGATRYVACVRFPSDKTSSCVTRPVSAIGHLIVEGRTHPLLVHEALRERPALDRGPAAYARDGCQAGGSRERGDDELRCR